VAQAQRPLIYISYGMRKSGSTLAFEFTRAILEQNGFRQKRLSPEAVPGDASINFVQRLTAAQLERIETEARALGYPIVLKTHLPPTPDVEAWVKAGRAQGHCVYRDPREMALSLMDHGRRARASGARAFSNIHTLDDAVRDIRRQVPHFTSWVRLPGFIPLYYDDVAFASQDTIRRLCEQMGLRADPAKVERHVKSWRPTQYNKGVPGRAKEMPPEDAARVREEFSAFFEEFIDPRPPRTAPLQAKPLPLRRIWSWLRRA
jgi:hypothetical protein